MFRGSCREFREGRLMGFGVAGVEAGVCEIFF